MAGAKIFSIEGKGLKLTTAEDIEPHIQDLKSNDSVEEIKFLGNTLGIGASEALAKVLESKKNLQVYFPSLDLLPVVWKYSHDVRLPTLPTSLLRVSSLRSRLRCRICLLLFLRYRTYTPSTFPTTPSV